MFLGETLFLRNPFWLYVTFIFKMILECVDFRASGGKEKLQKGSNTHTHTHPDSAKAVLVHISAR